MLRRICDNCEKELENESQINLSIIGMGTYVAGAGRDNYDACSVECATKLLQKYES